jgi:hypothetical protein
MRFWAVESLNFLVVDNRPRCFSGVLSMVELFMNWAIDDHTIGEGSCCCTFARVPSSVIGTFFLLDFDFRC